MKFPVYGIPGMGTDSRILGKLNVPGLIPIEWQEPKTNEPISTYAKRLAKEIPEGEPIFLLGLSLGGVVAQEICRIREIEGLILISSIKSSSEKPKRLLVQKHLPAYKLTQGSWRVKMLPYWAPLFGIDQKDEIELLQSMFTKFTDNYRFWAIKQLIAWQAELELPPFIHIHGDKDPVFPFKHIKEAKLIRGGDHFMVYRKADLVSKHINQFIDTQFPS